MAALTSSKRRAASTHRWGGRHGGDAVAHEARAEEARRVELREERPRERRSVALTRAERRRMGGVWQARRGRERWGSDPACRVAGRQRPGHASHGRVGMAAQERRWGADVWAHSTVSVGQVKSRSIDFKINLNGFKRFQNRSNFDRLKKGSSRAQKI
jgi:hypothetical protein